MVAREIPALWHPQGRPFNPGRVQSPFFFSSLDVLHTSVDAYVESFRFLSPNALLILTRKITRRVYIPATRDAFAFVPNFARQPPMKRLVQFPVSSLKSFARIPLPYFHSRNSHSGTSDGLLMPPAIACLETAAQNAQARSWIQSFKSAEIPRTVVQFTFARSSGPGGQVRKQPYRH